MKNNNFYNTTNLRGSKLKKEQIKKASQQTIVFNFMKKNRGKYTRSQLEFRLKRLGIRIDRHSIGRCLTNLMNLGLVEKLNYTIISKYGVGSTEHPYKYIKY